MSVWRLTTGTGSALLYKGDTHAGKLSSVLKEEVCRKLNEYESLMADYERLKTQLRLCEEHAGTMARDFDQSLAVVQAERDRFREGRTFSSGPVRT